MDELDDLNEQEKRIADLADRMLKRGRPREEVESFVARAMERQGRNRRDVENAGQINGLTKAATVAGEFADGATFGLTGLAGDAVAAGFDPNLSFADVREMRAAREKQTGVVGGIANLAGGLMTGGASLNAVKDIANAGRFANAIKSMANGGRLAKAGLAAGDAALQGGVSSAAQGMREGSWQGAKNAAQSGLVGLGAGAALGGSVGLAAGKVIGKGAQWIKGRQLEKQLVQRGVNLREAQAIASQLSDATPEAINSAIDRVEDFVRLGKGAEVTAADAIGVEGGRALRAATNISKQGDAIATQRLRSRDANIVSRSRRDVGQAAGFTPEQMDTYEQSLLADQRARANVSFGKAREEGIAFDAEHPFPRTHEAEVPESLDSFGMRDIGAAPSAPTDPAHELTRVALSDEIVRRKIGQLVSENPERYRAAHKDEWTVMHKVYTRINKEIGKLKKTGNDVGDYYDGLLTAKQKIGESLAARSKSFRAANAEFADIATGVEAYKAGGLAARSSLPSKARALQSAVAEGKDELFRKGNVDGLAEQMGIGPNAELGTAARAKQGVGQQAVATQNAAEKFRQIHGEDAYNALIDRAKAEGQFAATSHAAQGNSTSAKQVADMGLLPLVADVAGSLSVNPAWMLTMFGRRVGGETLNKVMKKIAGKKALSAADALTRGGSDDAKAVLESILEELARRRAAQQAGAVVSRSVRSGVARSAGRDY